jgi:hypothetical protein
VNTPSHLAAPGRRLWLSATGDFEIDPPGLELLRLACEALDRADEARVAIERDGAYIAGRYADIRPHPALAVERDSRLAAARLIRELGLLDPPDHPQPPQRHGPKRIGDNR